MFYWFKYVRNKAIATASQVSSGANVSGSVHWSHRRHVTHWRKVIRGWMMYNHMHYTNIYPSMPGLNRVPTMLGCPPEMRRRKVLASLMVWKADKDFKTRYRRALHPLVVHQRVWEQISDWWRCRCGLEAPQSLKGFVDLCAVTLSRSCYIWNAGTSHFTQEMWKGETGTLTC